jgi:hypothetical protein
MKESKLVLPFSYVAFLTGFLLLALITNKSIVKMPTDYYLGLGCPFLVLLIAAGVAAYPRPSALLGALVLLGTLSPTSMTKFTDYRQMVKQIHQQCPNCPILVGAGYAGSIPACVLYESKTQPVYLLDPEDSIDDLLQSMGDPQTLILVPANEPAISRIESQIVQVYPATRENGYFQVEVQKGKTGSQLTWELPPH